ncbi:putative short-chain dehydrogenase [Periconia macrospinosa]|uniref:3beta-hydroxysteroid 3-dehydrogenase n=1 Tax=Periconia macrospinosa TaxID=97972 RepID=A0A2V1DP65_9PLEO|nr:putative short-chain dehydrogenase [Periconia macrospinosa]
MASLKGTILITGANGGLGSALVRSISSSPELRSYHGICTVRNADIAPSLGSVLSHAPSSHTFDVLSLDLTDLGSVREAARIISARVSKKEIPPIRALILNAGFQDFGHQTWTSDGYDTTFKANYLGHWLLTLLLLRSMDKGRGRIIVVGSRSHDPDDPRNASTRAFVEERYKTFIEDETRFTAIAKGTWSSAAEDPSWRSGFRRYGASKLFLIMMMHELQRRLNRDPTLHDICVLGVDPGTMSTSLQRKAPWFIRVFVLQILYPLLAWLRPPGPARSTEQSASDILQAAFDSNDVLGEFPKDVYLDGTNVLETSVESRDVRKCRLVWEKSAEITGIKEDKMVPRHYY